MLKSWAAQSVRFLNHSRWHFQDSKEKGIKSKNKTQFKGSFAAKLLLTAIEALSDKADRKRDRSTLRQSKQGDLDVVREGDYHGHGQKVLIGNHFQSPTECVQT